MRNQDARAIYSSVVATGARGLGDSVVANRVTINPGSVLSFIDNENDALPPGAVFTVISNTGATPIAGAFTNLFAH